MERMRHLVRTPLGVCVVTLAREGLGLGDRGGFEAHWWVEGAEAYTEAEVIGLEAYRQVVKTYMAELYREQHGQEAGTVTLNLASHQLIDDLTGWTKLNWRPQ